MISKSFPKLRSGNSIVFALILSTLLLPNYALPSLQSPAIQLSEAKRLVMEGKYAEAEASLRASREGAEAAKAQFDLATAGARSEDRTAAFADLRQALQLDTRSVDAHNQNAQALVDQPLTSPAPPVIDLGREAELDRVILNAAILNGARDSQRHTRAEPRRAVAVARVLLQLGKEMAHRLDDLGAEAIADGWEGVRVCGGADEHFAAGKVDFVGEFEGAHFGSAQIVYVNRCHNACCSLS
jgi:hypothetical protein